MTKIIATLIIAVTAGVVTTALAKVAGFDPWWSEAIGTSCTICATIEGMRIWAKREGLAI